MYPPNIKAILEIQNGYFYYQTKLYQGQKYGVAKNIFINLYEDIVV
jgi:hypothetical protein